MKIVATLAVLLVAGSLSAQEYAFRVLINKGQNEIKTGNEWRPIHVGATLKSADELKISQHGYLGLVHIISGKPLEVKEAGTHRVSELTSRIRKGASVLHQYTDFILSAKPEKTNDLTATGSVHRGPDQINVLLPESKQAFVYGDEISIAWRTRAQTPVYVVRFNSMFGDELDKIEVRDTTVSIQLNGRKLADEDNILIEVSSKDQERKSESYMIKKLSAADKNRIKTSLAALGDVAEEITALNQLVLASFYESHSLLIDAATAYQYAIRLAPGVPYFREAYGGFLTRNGLLEQE